MSDRDFDDVRSEVNRGIGGEGWERIRHGSADWYGTFITDVMLGVGLRPVEHIDSNLTFDDHGFVGKVVVFTDRTVVIGDVVGSTEKDPTPNVEVRVLPLSRVSEMRIYEGKPAFGGDSWVDWPGDFKISVHWESGEVIGLPLRKPDEEKRRESFRKTYEKVLSEIGD